MSKILEYIKIGLKAVGKFLKFAYAPFIVLGVLSLLFGIFVSWLVGIIFLAIDVLLLINEIKLNKELELNKEVKV